MWLCFFSHTKQQLRRCGMYRAQMQCPWEEIRQQARLDVAWWSSCLLFFDSILVCSSVSNLCVGTWFVDEFGVTLHCVLSYDTHSLLYILLTRPCKMGKCTSQHSCNCAAVSTPSLMLLQPVLSVLIGASMLFHIQNGMCAQLVLPETGV